MKAKIVTYINGDAKEIHHFSSMGDALTALNLVGMNLGTFTGAVIDDKRIDYVDDYSGDRIVMEAYNG